MCQKTKQGFVENAQSGFFAQKYIEINEIYGIMIMYYDEVVV